MSKVPHVIVIGGGITGLAAAYRLKRRSAQSHRDVHVTLLEGSKRVGGVIETVERDGFLLETGPDSFVSEKPRALALCRELGLASDIIPTRDEFRRSFVMRKGRLFPVPEGFYLLGPSRIGSFLSSPLLSWRGKGRALLEPLISRECREDESLGSFVTRRLGKEMLNRFAQPLLAGIYAADPDVLSLAATFPHFLNMEKSPGSVLIGLRRRALRAHRASGARYSLFMTLRHGLQQLINTLERELGSTIRTRAKVHALSRVDSQWRVTLANNEFLEADAVCLSMPAHRSASLLRALVPMAANGMDEIPYANSATVYLGFRTRDIRHPLNGSGFVVPRVENRKVLACTFSHRKFAGRAPEDSALLRVFVGGALQPDLLAKEDDDLIREVFEDLRPVLGLLNGPVLSNVCRHPRALPQYTLGHLHRLQRIEKETASLEGFAMAGNWFHGVGIPDSIEGGEQAANRIWEKLMPERMAEAVAY